MPRNSWPFSKMVVGQTVRIRTNLTEARAAAHNIGHQKGWKFTTTLVTDPAGNRHLEVTRVARAKRALEALGSTMQTNIAVREAAKNGGSEGSIPDCMKPGGIMPNRYTGKYPFEVLEVGETMAFTREMVSLEAMGRLYSAGNNAHAKTNGARKYSVARGINRDDYQFDWVAVTRLR